MLILALALSLFFSAFFSAAETAFTSLNKIQLRIIKKNHIFVGKIAWFLYKRKNTLISAILIGNNTANVIFTVAATRYTLSVFGNTFIAVMTGSVVFIMLVFGEITPKQLALKYNSSFVIFSSLILVVLYFILLPFSKIFSFFSYFITFLNSKNPPAAIEGHIYHEHLTELLLQMGENKTIKASNVSRVRRALELSKKEVESIMTHRKNVQSISANSTITNAFELVTQEYHRHLPVCSPNNKEEIIGVVDIKDILQEKKQNHGTHTLSHILKRLKKEDFIIKIPKSLSIARALPFFQEHKSTFAIVIDEFGGLAGVLTLTDISRYILNPDLFSETSKNTSFYTDNYFHYSSEHIKSIKSKQTNTITFDVNAKALLSEIEEIISVQINPQPESHTIGGYLIEYTEGSILNEDSLKRKSKNTHILHPLLGEFIIKEKNNTHIISLLWNPKQS